MSINNNFLNSFKPKTQADKTLSQQNTKTLDKTQQSEEQKATQTISNTQQNINISENDIWQFLTASSAANNIQIVGNSLATAATQSQSSDTKGKLNEIKDTISAWIKNGKLKNAEFTNAKTLTVKAKNEKGNETTKKIQLENILTYGTYDFSTDQTAINNLKVSLSNGKLTFNTTDKSGNKRTIAYDATNFGTYTYTVKSNIATTTYKVTNSGNAVKTVKYNTPALDELKDRIATLIKNNNLPKDVKLSSDKETLTVPVKDAKGKKTTKKIKLKDILTYGTYDFSTDKTAIQNLTVSLSNGKLTFNTTDKNGIKRAMAYDTSNFGTYTYTVKTDAATTTYKATNGGNAVKTVKDNNATTQTTQTTQSTQSTTSTTPLYKMYSSNTIKDSTFAKSVETIAKKLKNKRLKSCFMDAMIFIDEASRKSPPETTATKNSTLKLNKYAIETFKNYINKYCKSINIDIISTANGIAGLYSNNTAHVGKSTWKKDDTTVSKLILHELTHGMLAHTSGCNVNDESVTCLFEASYRQYAENRTFKKTVNDQCNIIKKAYGGLPKLQITKFCGA